MKDIESVDIKYHRGSYSPHVSDDNCIINDIEVYSTSQGLLHYKQITLDKQTFKINQETSIQLLEEIADKIDKFEVTTEDNTDAFDQDEEELGEADAQIMYMLSGCESFDEFIDRYNSGE